MNGLAFLYPSTNSSRHEDIKFSKRKNLEILKRGVLRGKPFLFLKCFSRVLFFEKRKKASMKEPLDLKLIAKLLSGQELLPVPVKGFATDSHLVAPGSMFFALKGKNVDGHDYLEQVQAKGAIGAVVSKEYKRSIPGLSLIQVDDPLRALQELACFKASVCRPRCVAVTGSVGKTTTKEFIASILGAKFRVEKTPGNANSQVGLPLSLLNLEDLGEMFVAEMGMSTHGEIEKLLKIIPPELVVMTKVALAHAQYFPGGLEEIARAKAEILLHPNTKKAFVNMQSRQFKAFQRKEGPELIFYGLASDPSARRGDFLLHREKDLFFIEKDGERLTRSFPLPFTAGHFAENFLGSALLAKELGMDWEMIFGQALSLTACDRRFQKIEREGVVYINDAYNANPESVKAALENLPRPQEGKKVVAVLGEMRELGSFSQNAHRQIGEVASTVADCLFCLAGDAAYMAESFSLSGKPAYFFQNKDALKTRLEEVLEKGDVVLLKASKSLKMWEILESVD